MADGARLLTKFLTPDVTAAGDPRARVALEQLQTLWFNTGTLCNIECANCYIESSPKNDRLSYLPLGDVVTFLDEIATLGLPTREIGLTGGEPFMNPDIVAIMTLCLERGFELLVLTNAMKPMHHRMADLLRLKARFGNRLRIRVSIDHYDQALHEEERGPLSWAPMIAGLKWLSAEGLAIDAAGRTRWGDDEAALRDGFKDLFAREAIAIDADDPARLILFPEMDPDADVPEITTACWSLLNVSPSAMMCAGSRMVVRRKGEHAPRVLACTLLAYDEAFDMGATLAQSSRSVALNHPHCAKFCVLGGGSCTT